MGCYGDVDKRKIVIELPRIGRLLVFIRAFKRTLGLLFCLYVKLCVWFVELFDCVPSLLLLMGFQDSVTEFVYLLSG